MSKTLYQAGEEEPQQPPPSLGKVGYSKNRKDYKKVRPATVAPEQMSQSSIDIPLSEHSYGVGNPAPHRNFLQQREEEKAQKLFEKERQQERDAKAEIRKKEAERRKKIPPKRVKKDITFRKFWITDSVRDDMAKIGERRQNVFASRTDSLLRKKK